MLAVPDLLRRRALVVAVGAVADRGEVGEIMADFWSPTELTAFNQC